MKMTLTILTLIFLSLKSHSQTFNEFKDFYPINYNAVNVNFTDKDGLKQGRFVYCIEPNKDTIESKIVVQYRNDTLISEWTCFNLDKTIEVGKFQLNNKYEKSGIVHHFYSRKAGIWNCYNERNMLLYYISYNRDKKSQYSYDTIFNPQGKILKYYQNLGYNHKKADYLNGTLVYFNQRKGGGRIASTIEQKFYETGILNEENIKKEGFFTTRNISIVYDKAGQIQKRTIERKIHKKAPGVGEKWAYYSIRKKKEYLFNDKGKKIEFNKYENEELIKKINYGT